MSVENNKPVIFLVFANVRSGEGYLEELDNERRALKEILTRKEVRDLCQVEVCDGARHEDIVRVLQDKTLSDRIRVFHYAGHAEDYELLLEGPGGETRKAHAEGLAAMLAQLERLELVFLNGCSTRKQARGLLEANVSAVIATSRAIEDVAATEFSKCFYRCLAGGWGLEAAFRMAEGALVKERGSDPSSFYRDIGGKTAAQVVADEMPWKLHFRTGAETTRKWNLPDAVDMPLYGLPVLEPGDLDLPALPYRQLNWYAENDAEIFFGRGHQIRDLYHLVTDEFSDPIILYSGQSGVGKSSLLNAGLIPRLKARPTNPHQVRDFRRHRGDGMSAMMLDRLEGAPGTGFREAWAALEARTGQPVTVIADQVEEVFTRPRDGDENELDDFLDEVKRVFARRADRPAGKLIMSFRKEWVQDIKRRLTQRDLPFTELFLEALDDRGLREAIEGPTTVQRLRDKYRLTIEEGLAGIMAQDLLRDAKSSLAPTLQIRLGRMWERASADPPPHFDENLYRELDSTDFGLDTYLDQEFRLLDAKHAKTIASGLALDVLRFHTTPRGTAEARTAQAVSERYSHVLGDVEEFLASCEERYLLVAYKSADKKNGQQVRQTRLTHDSIAPLIRARFDLSNRPGQRARRVLENRAGEWAGDKEGATLDEADLQVVEAGCRGMRDLKSSERRLLEASRAALAQRLKTERRRRTFSWGVSLALAAVLILAGLVWPQVQKQRAQVRAAGVISLAKSLADENPLLATQLVASLNDESIPEPPSGVTVALDIARQAVPRYINRDHSPSGVNSVICDEQGSRLLTSSDDGSVQIWNFGQLEDREGSPVTLAGPGDAGPVRGAIFNPTQREPKIAAFLGDGTLLVGSEPPDWNPRVLGKQEGGVDSIAFSLDGRYLLTTSGDGEMRRWNTSPASGSEGEGDHGILLGEGYLKATYSPDAFNVVAIRDFEAAHIIDSRDMVTPGHLDDPENYTAVSIEDPGIDRAVFSLHSDLLFVIQFEGASLWKLSRTGEPEPLEVSFPDLKFARFISVDGRFLATVSIEEKIEIWKLDLSGSGRAANRKIAEFPRLGTDITGLDFCPSSNVLATSDANGSILVWDARGAIEPLVLSREDSAAIHAEFNHDGSQVVMAFERQPAQVVGIGAARAVPEWEFEGASLGVASSVDFSPVGQRILAVSRSGDGELSLLTEWAPEETDPARWTSQPPFSTGGRVALARYADTKDGLVLIPGDASAPAEVWRRAMDPVSGSPGETWRRTNELRLHGADIRHAAFSPRGGNVVTSLRASEARVGPADADDEKAVNKLRHKETVQMATFDASGKRIATASNDGLVRVFSTGGDGSPDQILSGTGDATSVAFDESGKRLAGSSSSGETRVWTLDGSGETVVIPGVGRSVNSASFSPGSSPAGPRVLTASEDGVVRLWRFRWRDLVQALDASTTQCLSPEDHKDYLGVKDDAEAEQAYRACLQRKKKLTSGTAE